MTTVQFFILFDCQQRQQAKAPSESVVELIGRAVGDVAPSLMLTAFSETSAFMLGAASSMPAVRTFSLFAGTAVFFNFLLQVRCVGMEMMMIRGQVFVGMEIMIRCEVFHIGMRGGHGFDTWLGGDKTWGLVLSMELIMVEYLLLAW